MANSSRCFMLFFPILIIILFGGPDVESLPVLHTNGRWIVDEGGNRVKLACVNWVSHLDPTVAEGLSKLPIDALISKGIKSLGFNCVRLTWPLVLATNDSFASITVRQSFQNLGLIDTISGFQANNPALIDLPLIKAYQSVVKRLGDNNVMVILDNHVTKPGWCCSNTDGNGFFGDQYFDPDLWIMGLTKMATLFNVVTNVVGMSLRNELRGPKQNVDDWYRYMPKGAEAVHAANPNVLVILSGLNFDLDLSFLQNQPVKLTFNGKLVFEMHWYSFSDGQAWNTGNPNQACEQVTRRVITSGGFLLDQGWPLFISEFGVDMRGTNFNDNRYFDCITGVLSRLDLDWSLWTLVGSYYLNQGVVGADEFYGLLNSDLSHVRNATFFQRLSAIQFPKRGKIAKTNNNGRILLEIKPHKVISHLLTGLCILGKSTIKPLRLGPCPDCDGWEYTTHKILTIKGTYFCLLAKGEGKPAILGTTCLGPNSRWEMISGSNKMYLSPNINNDSSVCLDVDTNNVIVTNTCKCSRTNNSCDPGSQWFNLVDTTRS